MKLTRIDVQILALCLTLGVALVVGDSEVAGRLLNTLTWLVAG